MTSPINHYFGRRDRFETEFRYFIEVSGYRVAIESGQENNLQTARLSLLSEQPEDANEINNIFDAVKKEAIGVDDTIREFLPIYQKDFTLKEIQELNRFYSTEVMQGMVGKIPLINQDLAPIQNRLTDEFLKRFYDRLG